MRYGPSPRSMKIGWPPTPPKARAGLLTPPGMRSQARLKAAWLRVRFIIAGLESVGAVSDSSFPHYNDRTLQGENIVDLLVKIGLVSAGSALGGLARWGVGVGFAHWL